MSHAQSAISAQRPAPRLASPTPQDRTEAARTQAGWPARVPRTQLANAHQAKFARPFQPVAPPKLCIPADWRLRNTWARLARRRPNRP
eukprot:2308188-Prymnesium_polylepis.1